MYFVSHVFEKIILQIGKPLDEDYGQTTAVNLTGSEESVAKAKQLIEEFLNSYNHTQRNSAGGGSFDSINRTSKEDEEEDSKPKINWDEVNKLYVSKCVHQHKSMNNVGKEVSIKSCKLCKIEK